MKQFNSKFIGITESYPGVKIRLYALLNADTWRVLNLLNNNKLYAGGRHNMPPPLSSLCGRRSASRRRADHGCRVQTAT